MRSCRVSRDVAIKLSIYCEILFLIWRLAAAAPKPCNCLLFLGWPLPSPLLVAQVYFVFFLSAFVSSIALPGQPRGRQAP
ncbi:hypothetical protein DFH27DRAFT_538276 [Peziza echinospora]|nr:hypothetical protein DFH27DRAFT_538276 [Peziza echinospora]